MEKNKQYPWSGCGTNKDITGCRFSLSVMRDDYVRHILSALKQVDTRHVWSHTDALSTTYRGHKFNVVNAVKELFIAANDGKTHMTLEATFTKGCPGDTEADIPLALSPKEKEVQEKKFDVLCKFSFYPMGSNDYMDQIAYVVNLAIDRNLYVGPSHYATELKGDVQDLFAYFNDIINYADEHIDHFIYQVTLSVNSPSTQ
ncbi:MAG: Ykof family thiamine-binding protein [Defluviitaleaceae bacterium]|nr:Ykof family thiamine-binding protein [Defluviitaleaceae bacterium]